MASKQFFHEIAIASDPHRIFDYITDPARWPEWFTSSFLSEPEAQAQSPGESFTVQTRQQLLWPLPFRMQTEVQCRVSKSDRPYLWEVEASSTWADAVTSYTLSRFERGCILKRHFYYHTRGWLRYAEPLLFRRRIERQARESLERLKARIESSASSSRGPTPR